MDKELQEAFLDLTCQLSPENLHCDGEISKSEAKRKLARIRNEWRALEKKAGRRVSETEAWSFE